MSRRKMIVIVVAVVGVVWMLWTVISMSGSGPEVTSVATPNSSAVEDGPEVSPTGPPLMEPLPPDMLSGTPVEGYTWTVDVPVNGLFVMPLPAEAETNPNITLDVSLEDPSLAKVAPVDAVGETSIVASPIPGEGASEYSGQVWRAGGKEGQTTVKVVWPGGDYTVRLNVEKAAP